MWSRTAGIYVHLFHKVLRLLNWFLAGHQPGPRDRVPGRATTGDLAVLRVRGCSPGLRLQTGGRKLRSFGQGPRTAGGPVGDIATSQA